MTNQIQMVANPILAEPVQAEDGAEQGVTPALELLVGEAEEGGLV